MRMGKTWNECTMSVLSTTTLQNNYLLGACHGSDLFPPEAHAGLKLVDKADVTK